MLRSTLFATLLVATPQLVRADGLRIVTDIAPVHGLVSMVAEGIATPDLLIDPAASPHTNAMRPSSASALQDADAVFWIGPELAPWLEAPLGTLSENAVKLALLQVDGTQTLEFRENEEFGAHDHNDHGHDHDDHGHDHAETDPHAWLDPANADVWLDAIAATLAQLDPDNAATYQSNAVLAKARIAVETEAAQTLLAPVASRPFVVFHDAYHYFESRFGLEAIGALSLSDAVPPSAARVAQIQADIRSQGVTCVFSEPQFSDSLVRTVTEGAKARTARLDPLGTEIDLGPDFYPALIRDMATRFADCLQ